VARGRRQAEVAHGQQRVRLDEHGDWDPIVGETWKSM
jgi:hypothetical protein